MYDLYNDEPLNWLDCKLGPNLLQHLDLIQGEQKVYQFAFVFSEQYEASSNTSYWLRRFRFCKLISICMYQSGLGRFKTKKYSSTSSKDFRVLALWKGFQKSPLQKGTVDGRNPAPAGML